MRSLPVLLLAAACSTTPAINVTATPDPLLGDGKTQATVTANVTLAGAPSSGIPVHFVATSGQFQEASPGTPLLADATTDDQGNAAATLLPSRIGWGSISFTASASVGGQQIAAQGLLHLAPNGGLAASLTFGCARQNIGALVTGRADPVHVLCTATAKDSAGRELADASIQTLAEAGKIDWIADELVYTAAPGDAPPVDVDPLGADGKPTDVCRCDVSRLYDSTACPGEPCWTDVTGLTHNPRDGVATLIAAVPAGPDAPDFGEPYLDTNDNGVHDEGEPYLDYNGNGRYDGASGKLGAHLLWTAYRIIWSGEADLSSAAHSSAIQISGRSFQLSLHDANFNALAADGPAGTDTVAFSAACDQGTLGDIPPGIAMPQVADGYPGMLFKSAPGQLDNGAIEAPGNHATYLGATDAYGFKFSYAPPDPAAEGSCTITAQVNRSYDPGAPGFEPGGSGSLQEVLTATFKP